MAIYYGMGENRLRMAIEKEVSHLQIHHPRFSEDQEAVYCFPEAGVRRVLDTLSNTAAYALRTIGAGMLSNATGSRGILVAGIDPVAEDATRSLSGTVEEGAYLTESGRHPILLGRKLADKLRIPLKGKVVLTLLDTAGAMTAAAFRVQGIYETANAPLDERIVYVRKGDLDALLGTTGSAHEAAVLLQGEGEPVERVQTLLEERLPGLKVETWKQISPETALVISSLDTYNLIFIGIILLALSFGIINTMLMSVLDRMRELGVLMAVGMSRRRVFGMVLLETVLLTLAGVPSGLLLSFATIAWVGRTGIDLGNIAGDTLRDFGYETVIHPVMPTGSLADILVLVLLTATLSALYPAWKAISLRPVEAIRR
jgi:ABC-type lipoprotein release transport system permease subunit